MSATSKILLIDLDYTLFDTAKFKKALDGRLSKIGIPKDVFYKTYNELVGYSWQKIYNFDEHLRILQKYSRFSNRRAKKIFRETIQESRLFLYPGAITFLQNLRERGFKLILLTFGNKKLQKGKVRYSKISKYFHKLIFTDKIKPKIIKKIVKKSSDQTIFINDNIEETAVIKKEIPNLRVVIKKIPGMPQHVPEGVAAFDSLGDIGKYLIGNKSF